MALDWKAHGNTAWVGVGLSQGRAGAEQAGTTKALSHLWRRFYTVNRPQTAA